MSITALKALRKNTEVNLQKGGTAFFRSVTENGTSSRVHLAESTGSRKTFDVRPAAVTGLA